VKSCFSIAAGTYNLWPQFSLEIPKTIAINSRQCYRITGTNGSGKSSLLKKLLLPLLKKTDCYYLYLEQQMSAQLFAVKAHAALNNSLHLIEDESQVASYLLENLQSELQGRKRLCCFVLDETSQYSRVLDFIREHDVEYVCFIISHDEVAVDLPVSTLAINSVDASRSRLELL
jgi:ABC-type sugar transport system ATPase subunit